MRISANTGSRRARILVAEDDTDLRDAMVETLRMDGHQVDDASNGAVALELALSSRPDVVVFDYAMPVTDGPRLVEQLRAYLRPAPVLVGISALVESRRWCADHGVSMFLMKPFEDETLRHAVSAAISEAGRPRTQRIAESGTRPAVKQESVGDPAGTARRGCVLAVGVARVATIRAFLPEALDGAKLVLVDTDSEAERILELIVPDLVVLDDVAESDQLRARALTAGVPVLVRNPTEERRAASSGPPRLVGRGG